MRKYIVEVTWIGYRETEAVDYNDAKQTSRDLNGYDGVVWSDFVTYLQIWKRSIKNKMIGGISYI